MNHGDYDTPGHCGSVVLLCDGGESCAVVAGDQPSEWDRIAPCMAVVLSQQRMETTGALSAAADFVYTQGGISVNAGEREEQVKGGVKR